MTIATINDLPHELISIIGDNCYKVADRARFYLTCRAFYEKCYASDNLCAHRCKYSGVLPIILSIKYKIRQTGTLDARRNTYGDITSRRILFGNITYCQLVKIGIVQIYDRLYIKSNNGKEYCITVDNNDRTKRYMTHQSNYVYERAFIK